MKFWNPTYESMSREEMTRVQSERLINTVKRIYHNVPFYRDTYPYGLFAVPLSEIVRIHASSGTTGRQTVVGYTRRDLDTWAEVMARTLTSAGASKESFIQIAYGYGLFTGGLGVHYGAERI